MRIVHTSLRYPPASGGAETYVKEIVERTRNIHQQRDVRVLTSKLRTHGPIAELDPNLLLDDPIYVQRLHHTQTPWVSYPRLQALKYYISHHQPDILHSYGFWYQPPDVTARYARRHHIPFIFHPIYYENKIRQKLSWQIYKKTIGRQTFAAADVVAVISPFEQSLIEKAGFPVKRFELIPPGIDIQQYQTPRINPFLKRKIIGPILLSAGRISKGKALADIISALPAIIKEFPAIQLVIAGEDFGAKKDLGRQAKRIGVDTHVHWLGKLSPEELIGAYQHADIFVHPSHYEAFGIVLAEALACQTPVVARKVAAIPYVVPDQRAGLLFETTNELITAITTLLRNPPLREQYGQAGYKHIVNNFNWDRSIRKILALYDEFQRI
jgi:glycosyltransferase involved in cell wall biosynthesis